jgi:antitoxin component of MazEF toxin-antitoxin module
LCIQKDVLIDSKIFKQGNSCAIRLPKSFLNSLGLKEDDIVSLKLEENKIIIEKKDEEITIEELFKNYHEDYKVEEDFNDLPIGREEL